MSAEFADTNVVRYLLDEGPKADRAEAVMSAGTTVSVQVLNEVAVNCRRKAGMTWAETARFLDELRALCPVASLTVETHQVRLATAERYRLSVHDSMIAAALLADCSTLLTEVLQDGLLIEDCLRVSNPYA
jgi:predicted nucleic acid-binding protein